MVTNLNETFAAVQAASRELAIQDDTIINQILNAVADAAIAETPFYSGKKMKKTSHEWIRMIQSMTG